MDSWKAMQLWNGVNGFKKEMKLESVLYLQSIELWNIVPRRYCFDEEVKEGVSKKFYKENPF